MLSNGGFKLGLCVSEFPVLHFGTAAERQNTAHAFQK